MYYSLLLAVGAKPVILILKITNGHKVIVGKIQIQILLSQLYSINKCFKKVHQKKIEISMCFCNTISLCEMSTIRYIPQSNSGGFISKWKHFRATVQSGYNCIKPQSGLTVCEYSTLCWLSDFQTSSEINFRIKSVPRFFIHVFPRLTSC